MTDTAHDKQVADLTTLLEVSRQLGATPEYYRALLEQTAGGDASREGLREARQYLETPT